jgi:hypothetical protein
VQLIGLALIASKVCKERGQILSSLYVLHEHHINSLIHTRMMF